MLPLGAPDKLRSAWTPGLKFPPPRGFTGHGNPDPSGADVEAWIMDDAGACNIGLRLPVGVLGLDVDAYNGKRGGEELAALIEKYGPLPDTWITGARTDGVSGIRLYTVPTELDGRPINWPGEAAKNIEIIQHGHRYAVVSPSTNPEAAGAQYAWRFGPTGPMRTNPDDIPAPGEFPELPEAWARGLALSYERTDKSDLGSGAMRDWWSALRPGPACDVVQRLLMRSAAEIRDTGGSRHETARDRGAALARLGGEGHRGVADALLALGQTFEAAVGAERAAGGEWGRLLSGAVKLAATSNPEPRQRCSHDPVPAAFTIEAPPGFSLPTVATASAPATVGALPSLPPLPVALPADESRSIVDDVLAEVEALPADERDDRVRHIAASLPASGAGEADVQRAAAALTTRGGMSGVTLTEWRAIAADAKRQAKEAAKQAAVVQARLAAAAEVAARREVGQLLPPPHAPMDVARELAASLPTPCRWWRGDFYRHTGTHYQVWEDESVDHWLYRRTEAASFDAGEDAGPKPWRPNPARIDGVAHALSRGVLYRESRDDPDDDPAQVACANGVYDIVTGELLPHTPARFNLASLPFAYDPAAECPGWLWFLADVLPPDAVLLLQEWFGYVISGRTDMEKILHMQGRPRSGKGTVAHVLEALLGPEATASPSMPSLVGTFGEQPLIGKTLGIFSDINWAFRDIAEAVEIVKKISGRDTRDVNRKNRDAWHGKLGVRFMIMGNDLPKFTDASGALAHRMMHVQFPGTVMGRENPALKDDLLKELPGVLNWALAGLRRLTANGTFTVPQSAADLAADVRRQQGPAQAFLDDTCAFTETANPVPLDELYPAYAAWAKDAGIERPLNREHFGRALSSAGVPVKRERVNGVRVRRAYGIVPQVTDDGRSAWTALRHPLGEMPPVPPA